MWCPTTRFRTGPSVVSTPVAVLVAVVAVVAVVALAAAGCSNSDDGTGDDASSATASDRLEPSPDLADEDRPEPELTDTACADPGVPAETRCQTLTVPEDRARPEGRQVELPVLRLAPAVTADAVPAEVPPVIVLHGGPGGSGVGDWSTWTTRFDGLAEVVLWDQRGGGASTPRLDCPEHTEALLAALESTDEPTAERGRVADAVRACHERLTATGTDLDSYDTPASTQDLEDLRRAIGAERITLVGSSYGTRLALDYLRTYPQRVHSLVLDSVDPPRAAAPSMGSLAEDAVDRLVAECTEDTRCATAHPDLRGELNRVLSSFDATPRTLSVAPTDGSPARTMALTGADLFAGLFLTMYDGDVVPLLPSLITAVGAVGVADGSLLDTFSSRVLPALSSTATGAFLSIDCADAGRPGDRGGSSGRSRASEDAGRAATLALAGSLPFCDVWPVDPVPGSFHEPVDPEDAPPTLIVSGELDPITPAADGRALAERLHAHHLEIPRGGHAPMLVHPCAQEVLGSFLADPSAPDLSCAEDLTPLPFT